MQFSQTQKPQLPQVKNVVWEQMSHEPLVKSCSFMTSVSCGHERMSGYERTMLPRNLRNLEYGGSCLSVSIWKNV